MKYTGNVYRLTTSLQDLEGIAKIDSVESGVTVELPEIKWADCKPTDDLFIDDLESVGSVDTFGVTLIYDPEDGKLKFQNYGNAMNYYVLFHECDDKFVYLERNDNSDF